MSSVRAKIRRLESQIARLTKREAADKKKTVSDRATFDSRRQKIIDSFENSPTPPTDAQRKAVAQQLFDLGKREAAVEHQDHVAIRVDEQKIAADKAKIRKLKRG